LIEPQVAAIEGLYMIIDIKVSYSSRNLDVWLKKKKKNDY
jgi:hypothetical protein